MKKFFTLALSVIPLLSFSQTTYTWDGGFFFPLWNQPQNWDPDGLPGPSDDVIIPAGFSVSIASAQEINDITIDATSSLNCLSSGFLTVNGTAIVNGTLDVSTSGGGLILTSSASGSASLGNSSGTITGTNFTVNTYLSSAAAWRTLAPTIPGLTIADWDDDIYISGVGGADGDAAQGGVFVSMYEYDETVSGVMDSGYVTASSLNHSEGYLIYIDQLGEGMISVTGAPYNSGSKTLPASCSNGCGTDDGWVLMGNPYPSTISWAGCSKSFISGRGGGTAYALQTSGNYASLPKIASGQGFWVQANSAIGAQVVIPQSAKTTSDPGYFKTFDESVSLKISSNINSYSDQAFIFEDQNASELYEENYDDTKLFTPNPWEVPSLSFVATGNIDLYSNSIRPLNEGETISLPIRVKVGISGDYDLVINGFENILPNHEFVLEDLNTNELTPVVNGEISKSFYIDNLVEEPFLVLHISKNDLATGVYNIENDGDLIVYPNPAQENVVFKFKNNLPSNSILLIKDNLGRIVREINVSNNSSTVRFDRNNESNGVYFYEFINDQSTLHRGKFILN